MIKLLIYFLSVGLVLSQNLTEICDIDCLIGKVFEDPAATPKLDKNLTNSTNILEAQPLLNTNQQKDNCSTGECVPHYLCSSNNEIITNGENINNNRIKIEQPSERNPKECYDYLKVCCQSTNIVNTAIIPDIIPKSGCGNRNVDGVGFRIDSNYEAQFGEFPWMVAILMEESSTTHQLNSFLGGGSLIHTKVVLTAAHIIYNKSKEKLKIRAGEWDTQTKDEMFEHQDRNVAQVIVHPDFHSRTLYNDIALIIINDPMILSDYIQTACLPPQSYNFDNQRCTVSGWGKDVFGREGKYQAILKLVEMPTVPHRVCQDSLRRTRVGKRFILHQNFLCAGGEEGKDVCTGDGGSPLICPIPNTVDRYFQSGIVAFGIGCGDSGIPGVYSNVAAHKNWIDEQFRQHNLDTSSYSF